MKEKAQHEKLWVVRFICQNKIVFPQRHSLKILRKDEEQNRSKNFFSTSFAAGQVSLSETRVCSPSFIHVYTTTPHTNDSLFTFKLLAE
jgi:hypothetical protein